MRVDASPRSSGAARTLPSDAATSISTAGLAYPRLCGSTPGTLNGSGNRCRAGEATLCAHAEGGPQVCLNRASGTVATPHSNLFPLGKGVTDLEHAFSLCRFRFPHVATIERVHRFQTWQRTHWQRELVAHNAARGGGVPRDLDTAQGTVSGL